MSMSRSTVATWPPGALKAGSMITAIRPALNEPNALLYCAIAAVVTAAVCLLIKALLKRRR